MGQSSLSSTGAALPLPLASVELPGTLFTSVELPGALFMLLELPGALDMV